MTYPSPIHNTLSGTPLLLYNLVEQQDDCGSELLSMVEHYIQLCCRRYYTIDYATQQDIAQEASVRLLLHYEEMRYTISKRWLYVMVKNICIDTLRKQRNKNQLTHFEPLQEESLHTPDMKDFCYSTNFDHHECLERVFAYISAQPTGEQDLTIYSHFAYGLSRDEIAQLTGRTVNSITKRISILRSRLKELRNKIC